MGTDWCMGSLDCCESDMRREFVLQMVWQGPVPRMKDADLADRCRRGMPGLLGCRLLELQNCWHDCIGSRHMLTTICYQHGIHARLYSFADYRRLRSLLQRRQKDFWRRTQCQLLLDGWKYHRHE